MESYKLMKRHSVWSARRRGFILASAFVLGVFLIAHSAIAGNLADYMPQPASPFTAEMIWNGSELYQGPGAIGTGFGVPGAGDGESPVSAQFPSGLTIETPYVINGVPGSVVNTTAGSTTFYDATLLVIPVGNATNGLPAVGSAVLTPLGAGITMFSQLLGSGKFEVWSTDPVTAADNDYTLLLTGTIDSAVITGILGSGSGAAVSATVTYTGGKILEVKGFAELTGELSWSLLDATPKFAINPTNGRLDAFQANSVGQFSDPTPMPEPGTLFVLLSAVPIALIGWGRRRMAGKR